MSICKVESEHSDQVVLNLAGLEVTLFGIHKLALECNNIKNKSTAVTCVFALHGRGDSREFLFESCRALVERCYLPASSSHQGRVVLLVAFDFPNHGIYYRDPTLNLGWKANMRHGMDMWSQQLLAVHQMEYLMQVLPFYLSSAAVYQSIGKPIPVDEPFQITTWGVYGVSLGGHAALLALAKMPKVFKVVVSIIGCADYESLMLDRLSRMVFKKEVEPFQNCSCKVCLPLEGSSLTPVTEIPPVECLRRHFYLPSQFLDTVRKESLCHIPLEELYETSLLLLQGEKDLLVPAKFNIPFYQALKAQHPNPDKVNMIIEPGAEHSMTPFMKESLYHWFSTWL